MSKSEDALKEAFAGESQANRKYLAYTAEKEAPETCPVCGAKGKMFKKVD